MPKHGCLGPARDAWVKGADFLHVLSYFWQLLQMPGNSPEYFKWPQIPVFLHLNHILESKLNLELIWAFTDSCQWSANSRSNVNGLLITRKCCLWQEQFMQFAYEGWCKVFLAELQNKG